VNSGALQLTLFDQRDMASITSPVDPLRGSTPGERLVACRNPDLAAEPTAKREDLLVATERDLAGIKTAVGRKRDPLRATTASSRPSPPANRDDYGIPSSLWVCRLRRQIGLRKQSATAV
jgi:hypothetical protein